MNPYIIRKGTAINPSQVEFTGSETRQSIKKINDKMYADINQADRDYRSTVDSYNEYHLTVLILTIIAVLIIMIFFSDSAKFKYLVIVLAAYGFYRNRPKAAENRKAKRTEAARMEAQAEIAKLPRSDQRAFSSRLPYYINSSNVQLQGIVSHMTNTFSGIISSLERNWTLAEITGECCISFDGRKLTVCGTSFDFTNPVWNLAPLSNEIDIASLLCGIGIRLIYSTGADFGWRDPKLGTDITFELSAVSVNEYSSTSCLCRITYRCANPMYKPPVSI